jgi:hypothetical protein
MPTSDQYIGRREGIGVGIEATEGVAVAPQTFLRWLDQDIQNKTNVIENESAMGVVDRVNDSEIVAKYAEGKIGGKLTDLSAGFWLAGFFGLPTTGAAVSGVYPHTFQMSQSSKPAPALTITRVNPLDTQRHSYGVVDALEFNAEAGGWVELAATVKARVGASASDTIALVAEKEFTSKHITVKLADDSGSLAAATALDASKVSLTLERPSEMWMPFGTDEDAEFDRGQFDARGELIVRYKDTQYEEQFLANTIRALSINIANGSDAEVTFTATQVRYRELERSTDKDGVVTQTLSWAAELDTATGRSVQAVLKNTRATYEAA